MRLNLEPIFEPKGDFAEILAKNVKRWTEKEVVSYRAKIDDNFEIAERALEKLFLDIGVQKLTLPEAKGGLRVNPKELLAVLLRSFEEIEKASAKIEFALLVVVSSSSVSRESEALDKISDKLSTGLCKIVISPPQFGTSGFKGLQLTKTITARDRVRASSRPLNSGYDAYLFAFFDYNGASMALVDAKDVDELGQGP